MNYTDEQKENILKFYPSIEEMEKQTAIRKAQQYLNDTDYILIKIKEYEITGKQITEDYTEILNKREEAREVIRNLR